MALRNWLFVSRKKQPLPTKPSSNQQETSKSEFYCSHNSWRPFDLSDKEFVRVLLYRECDSRGCKLLYDSKTVQKVPLTPAEAVAAKRDCKANGKKSGTDHFVEVNKDFGYQYLKASQDAKMISELVFGSVAMSYKGTTLKVHTLKSPPQVMCSRIFPTPRTVKCARISDHSLEDSIGSSLSSMNEYEISRVSTAESDIARSCPMDVPDLMSKQSQPNTRSEEDSGFGGDITSLPSWMSTSNSGSSIGSYFQSFASSIGNSSSNPASNSGSLNSLQRRWIRNKTTSFDFTPRRDSLTSSLGEKSCQQQARSKLGVAVLIDTEFLSEAERRDFTQFTFTHMAIIDSILARLQENIERAYLHKQSFVHSVSEAVDDLTKSLLDLYSAPRLLNPVWLCMISRGNRNNGLAAHFLSEFVALVEQYDTKGTNFFMSTLLTAVLTHHLAWVPTVTPSGTTEPGSNNGSCSQRHTVESLDDLHRNHPYNPLWAQLGDLLGALGHPRKVARTVITGRAANLLDRFLWVLSYFVRCNQVTDNPEERHVPNDEDKKQRLRGVSANRGGLYPSLEGLDLSDEEDPSSRVARLCRVTPEVLSYHVSNEHWHSGPASNKDMFNKHEQTKGMYPSLADLDTEEAATELKRVVFTLGDDDKEDVPQNDWSNKNGISRIGIEIPEPQVEKCRAVGRSVAASNVVTVKASYVDLEPVESIKDTNLYLRDYNSVRFGSPLAKVLPSDDSWNQGPREDVSPRSVNASKLLFDDSEHCTGLLSKYIPVPMPRSVPVSESPAPANHVSSLTNACRLLSVPSGCFRTCLESSGSKCSSFRGQSESKAEPSRSSSSGDLKYKYGSTHFGATLDHYNSDLILHGFISNEDSTSIFNSSWAQRLQRDLALATQQSVLDEDIDGAVCIIAKTDTWEVQLVSSHAFAVDKPGTLGIQVGMSHLVANILESVLNLWKLSVPPDFCLVYLEDRLQELYLRSEALAQYLLNTPSPHCNMDQVTSTFGIEVNDVPLLMAVASIHTPKVTQMYGLSFR